jgi:hypothetical protein
MSAIIATEWLTLYRETKEYERRHVFGMERHPKKTEPEFLNISKCNSAESASVSFLYIFNDKTNMYT